MLAEPPIAAASPLEVNSVTSDIYSVRMLKKIVLGNNASNCPLPPASCSLKKDVDCGLTYV